MCYVSTCQQSSQPIFCSSELAIKVDLAAKSTSLGWSRSTVLHLGWGVMMESPARVMLTPSVVQPSHPLELNAILVNTVPQLAAWQLCVSTLQSSRPIGHLGISLESELYLQPYGKIKVQCHWYCIVSDKQYLVYRHCRDRWTHNIYIRLFDHPHQ